MYVKCEDPNLSVNQGFKSQQDIPRDIEMRYHPMYQDRTVLPSSQHPNQDILGHLLSQVLDKVG